jgi:uncharacterized protein YxeA
MMILALILIVIFVYVFVTQSKNGYDALTPLIKETHKYSGIHEDSYSQFYANIQMAREYKSETFLKKAIEHLNEIPLYMTPIDPDVQGDIALLGEKIMNTFKR